MKTTTLTALTLLLTYVAGAQANHIDFFSDGGFALDEITGFAAQTGDPGNIFGAEREVEIVSLGSATADLSAPLGAGPAGPDPTTTLDFTANAFSFLALTYDGTGSSGLGGINLPGAPGWNSLDLLFTALFGEFEIDLTIADTFGNADIASRTVNSATSAIFSFSEFTSVDFTSVDSIDVLFTTAAEGSFSLGQISREVQAVAVSAPATLGLLVMGIFGIGPTLIKRKQQK